MSVGAQIKLYRQKLGWKLKDLSDACDVEIGTLSALEIRGSQKSLFIPQIAKAFGFTVEQLLDESKTYTPDPEKFKSDKTTDSVNLVTHPTKSNTDPWIKEAVLILESIPAEDRRAAVANLKTFVMNLGPPLTNGQALSVAG